MSLIKKINDPNGKKYDDFSIGSLVLDTEPIPGSFNPVTSDAVVKAIDKAKDDMQEKIDEVTLDPSAVALGNVHLLDEVTEFPADGCILVDSETNGPGEMSKDTLLTLTSQNALADNVAPAFVENYTNAKAGFPYVWQGALYMAKEDYSGDWDVSKFDRVLVFKLIDDVKKSLDNIIGDDGAENDTFYIADSYGNVVLKVENGHISSKNFNSQLAVKSVDIDAGVAIFNV